MERLRLLSSRWEQFDFLCNDWNHVRCMTGIELLRAVRADEK